MRTRPASPGGFSLIEVLITVFVVAVGLLSVAGLQAQSKKASYDAVQRTTAAALSQDIIERMRANPAQIGAYTGKTVSGALSAPAQLCTSTSITTTCSPAQTAAYDLYLWSLALAGTFEQDSAGNSAGSLTSATGCIIAGATPGDVTVAVAWRGVTPLANPTTDTRAAAQCGVSTPANPDYDLVPGSADGLLRRVLVVQTFVN